MAPQSVSHMMRLQDRGSALTDDRLAPMKERAARLDAQRGPSSKVVKVRQEAGQTSVLSTVEGRQFRRKQLKRTGAAGKPQRSVVARQRGYFSGPTGARGVGRETGSTDVLRPSARADSTKIAAPGRPVRVGFALPRVGG